MRPEVFFDEQLGWMSSHPRHQKRRRRLLQLLAFVPIAAVILLGAVFAANHEQWIVLIRHARTGPILLGSALAAVSGALLTMALSARWAELQRQGKIDMASPERHVYLEKWVLVVAMLLGVVGPAIALGAPQGTVPMGVRFALHLFAVGPVVGLLVGMWAKGTTSGDPRTAQRRPIWLVLLIIALTLLVLTLLLDLAQVLQLTHLSHWIARLLPFYAGLQQPFLGLLILAPVCYLLLAAWRLWPARGVPSEAGPDDVEQPTRHDDLLSRLIDWFRRLFLPPASQTAPQKNPWPEWLDQLLAGLPDGCRTSGKPQLLDSSETSEVSNAESLKTFFGDVVPTVDQRNLFQRFCDSYQEVIEGIWSPPAGGRPVPSADLLIEGDTGSGRTTALVACALYAAIGRGQRVLFLVANERRQNIIKRRIDQVLEAVQIHHYLRAEIITHRGLQGWISVEEPNEALPQILIGTLAAAEEHLFGAEYLTGAQFERLRRLVLLLEVVLADDFMDFDDAQRSHLPFLLDKQRLLLEADYVPLQVAVTCPRLAKIAKTGIGARLFTETRLRLDRNVLTLRPRSCGRAWRVELEADDVADSVEQMVVWCLKHGLDVVLYRRGIDTYERQRQENQLRQRAGGQKSLTVISDLDQPLNLPAGEVEAVFYQVAAHQEVCLALRLHMGNDESVIFSVKPTGEIRDVPVPGIVPVVADRSARPLMVSHLRSATRFIRPATPISEDTWSQFGLRYEQLQVARSQDQPEVYFQYDRCSGDPEYASQVWPYVSLVGRRSPATTVDTHLLPDESCGVFRMATGPNFFIGRLPRGDGPGAAEADPSMRRAHWYNSAGQPLHQSTDLAHARSFHLVHGSDTFVPRPPIRKTPDGFRIETQHWQGTGNDAYLPVYSLQWEIPEAVAEPLGGGPDYAVQWFNLDTVEPKAVEIQASIEKLMTEYGVETAIDSLRFTYLARFAAILFRPVFMDSADLGGTIGRALSGSWGTAPPTWRSAALSGAMNYALAVRLPGLTYFAQSLSFWLGDDETKIAAAVTWFIEPVTTGRTVMPILGQVLTSPEERKSFFESILWFLDALDTAEPKTRFLRRFTRVGYQGDETVDRIDETRQLVRDVLQSTDLMMNRVAETSR